MRTWSVPATAFLCFSQDCSYFLSFSLSQIVRFRGFSLVHAPFLMVDVEQLRIHRLGAEVTARESRREPLLTGPFDSRYLTTQQSTNIYQGITMPCYR